MKNKKIEDGYFFFEEKNQFSTGFLSLLSSDA